MIPVLGVQMLWFKLGFHAVAVSVISLSLGSLVGCKPTPRTIAVIDQKIDYEDDQVIDSGPGIIAITATSYKGKGSTCSVPSTERFEILAAKQVSSETLSVTLKHEIPGCSVGKIIEVKNSDVVIEGIEVEESTGARVSRPGTPQSFGTSQNFTFPISYIPADSYTTSGRGYGARRSGGRLHAANDLLGKKGNPVLSVGSGIITDYYEFYCGTFAIVVNHGSFVVRYGEVSGMAPGVKVGSRIQKGQVIGKMGALCGGSAMLHFEKYKGTHKGQLTVRENLPFQRRRDLEDPTSFLNSLKSTVKNSI
jgi:murein DD-endopeptidase MepM/ murein hydrolase activator NlpD